MNLLFAVASLAIGFSQEASPGNSLAHYQSAEIFMRQQNYQSAANEFRAALSGDLEPKWIEAQSHLNLGRIFDITGQSERALNEYALANRSLDNAGPALLSEPTESTEPEYSDEARLAGLEGIVLLTAAIREDGSARDLRVSRPLGLGLDEKAIEAVKGWRFRPGVPATTVAVDFLLPSKQSRWHLVRAAFGPPEGASRPVFLSAPYPPGAGVARTTIEEARIVAAVGRLATATLAFDVDEGGRPVHFQVQNASEAVWGSESIALVSGWRFRPGVKNGAAVTVPCTLDLAWGRRDLTSSALAQLMAGADSTPPPPPDVFPEPAAGTHRLRIDGRVQEARVIETSIPEYPLLAKQARIQGTVSFYVLIGSDGRVQELRLIGGHPLLVQAATDAVNRRVYRQTMVNGKVAEVATKVDVEFRLSELPGQ